MTQHYLRYKTIPVDTFLQHIRDEDVKAEVEGYRVGVGGSRLRTFKHKGLSCVGCGIKGSFFAIETFASHADQSKSVHVNFWAVKDDGEEVLMTSDHIVAKSRGGAKTDLSNRQTMCFPCNNRKGQGENPQHRKGKQQ